MYVNINIRGVGGFQEGIVSYKWELWCVVLFNKIVVFLLEGFYMFIYIFFNMQKFKNSIFYYEIMNIFFWFIYMFEQLKEIMFYYNEEIFYGENKFLYVIYLIYYIRKFN